MLETRKKDITKDQSGDYPKLMIRDDGKYIALFSSENNGTVVHINCGLNDTNYRVGEHSYAFNMEHFEDYKGEVTLTST